FPGPPLGIPDRPGRMQGTSMPETAIDEDRHSLTRKNDIGLASEPGQGPAVYPEAETRAVECRAQAKLQGGIAAPVRLHRSAHPKARRPRGSGLNIPSPTTRVIHSWGRTYVQPLDTVSMI